MIRAKVPSHPLREPQLLLSRNCFLQLIDISYVKIVQRKMLRSICGWWKWVPESIESLNNTHVLYAAQGYLLFPPRFRQWHSVVDFGWAVADLLKRFAPPYFNGCYYVDEMH